MAAVASFSYKIGGGGLIFLQNWRRWPHFPTKLAAVASFSYKIGGGGKDLATLLVAVLTWSGYWMHTFNQTSDFNQTNDYCLRHALKGGGDKIFGVS